MAGTARKEADPHTLAQTIPRRASSCPHQSPSAANGQRRQTQGPHEHPGGSSFLLPGLLFNPCAFYGSFSLRVEGATEVNATRTHTKASERTKRLQCHSLHRNRKTYGPSVTGCGQLELKIQAAEERLSLKNKSEGAAE